VQKIRAESRSEAVRRATGKLDLLNRRRNSPDLLKLTQAKFPENHDVFTEPGLSTMHPQKIFSIVDSNGVELVSLLSIEEIHAYLNGALDWITIT
tara:strand:- start:386 stop:670 length:285 start_codon:yes stop_codon:yes gene_type:complete